MIFCFIITNDIRMMNFAMIIMRIALSLLSRTNMQRLYGLPGLFQSFTWDPWDWVSEELWHRWHLFLCKRQLSTNKDGQINSYSLLGSQLVIYHLWHLLQKFTECISGCICPDGLVSDGEGGCINETKCPCLHNGKLYKPGQTMQVDCNTWFVQHKKQLKAQTYD